MSINKNNNNTKKKIRCVNAIDISNINSSRNKTKNTRGHYRTGDINSDVELPMHLIPGTDPLRYRCEDCYIREVFLDPWFRKLGIPTNEPQMQDDYGRIASQYYWQYLNNLEIEGKRDAPPERPHIL
jgi:hypothetical protein